MNPSEIIRPMPFAPPVTRTILPWRVSASVSGTCYKLGCEVAQDFVEEAYFDIEKGRVIHSVNLYSVCM